jgi:hypothetical protein
MTCTDEQRKATDFVAGIGGTSCSVNHNRPSVVELAGNRAAHSTRLVLRHDGGTCASSRASVSMAVRLGDSRENVWADGVVDGAVGFPTLPPRAGHEDAPPPAVQDEDVAGGSRPIHPSSTSTAATGVEKKGKNRTRKTKRFLCNVWQTRLITSQLHGRVYF